MILVDTGARSGKELLELKWKNITYRAHYVNDTYTDLDDEGNVVEKKIQIGFEDAGDTNRTEALIMISYLLDRTLLEVIIKTFLQEIIQ